MASENVAAADSSLWLTWRRLMAGAGTRAPRLRACLLGITAAAVLQGLSLVCIVPMFEAVLERRAWTDAVAWLLAMGVLAGVSAALRWWAQGFDFRGEMTATSHALRTRLGQQLRRMPLEALQAWRSGEVNNTVLGNVDENLAYVLTVANLMAVALVCPLVVALALCWLDWRIGAMLLLALALLWPLYRWQHPGLARSAHLKDAAHRRTAADIVEYTQGLQVMRAACCEGESAAGLQAGFRHLRRIQAEDLAREALPSLLVGAIMELGMWLIVCAGAAWVVGGSLSLATLAAVAVLVARFAEPLATFIMYTKVIDLVAAALLRIEHLLSVAPLPVRMPVAEPTRFDVAFDEVCFRYAGASDDTIRHLSLQLPACGMTALVGPSGCGKTTLTRLLMRFADPQQGRVCIGGVDVRTIAPARLNALISVVFQDVYLFDDTIAANIRLARPDASDAAVMAAARAAHCHDFIMRLPDGYATRVGAIGGRLSGGERQRISIARAMLKNAPIVVLDEPTAALDTESERAVQQAIDALVCDKTVIVIAHRLSTVVGADRIVVIDDGRLVAQGTHAHLLAQGGRYHAMWQAQMRCAGPA